MKNRKQIVELARTCQALAHNDPHWFRMSASDLERFYARAYQEGEAAERHRLGAFVEEVVQRAKDATA